HADVHFLHVFRLLLLGLFAWLGLLRNRNVHAQLVPDVDRLLIARGGWLRSSRRLWSVFLLRENRRKAQSERARGGRSELCRSDDRYGNHSFQPFDVIVG